MYFSDNFPKRDVAIGFHLISCLIFHIITSSLCYINKNIEKELCDLIDPDWIFLLGLLGGKRRTISKCKKK